MWTKTFPLDVRGFYMMHVESSPSKVDSLALGNTPLPCHDDFGKKKKEWANNTRDLRHDKSEVFPCHMFQVQMISALEEDCSLYLYVRIQSLSNFICPRCSQLPTWCFKYTYRWLFLPHGSHDQMRWWLVGDFCFVCAVSSAHVFCNPQLTLGPMLYTKFQSMKQSHQCIYRHAHKTGYIYIYIPTLTIWAL